MDQGVHLLSRLGLLLVAIGLGRQPSIALFVARLEIVGDGEVGLGDRRLLIPGKGRHDQSAHHHDDGGVDGSFAMGLGDIRMALGGQGLSVGQSHNLSQGKGSKNESEEKNHGRLFSRKAPVPPVPLDNSGASMDF